MHVAELWRYPVKSLGGERVEMVEVTAHGLVGDRRFGIVDVATGNVLTARREPKLLFARATWQAEGVEDADRGEPELFLDDGRVLRDDADLSDWLGRPVRLRRAGGTGGTFENPVDFEVEDEWETWTGPPHAWHDSKRTRVSLVHRATLGPWSVARFRPNVVLDGPESARAEDALVDQLLSVGSTDLVITKQVDRCVMVTRPQPGVDRDLDVLRSLHRQHGGNLAIGALVRRSGIVTEGDEVRVLD